MIQGLPQAFEEQRNPQVVHPETVRTLNETDLGALRPSPEEVFEYPASVEVQVRLSLVQFQIYWEWYLYEVEEFYAVLLEEGED
ncbi:hypothetical protein CspHIS471_0200760 [Cutaneotrichosporon sp. HIS471]|nr:hypothetical protein CspHIS471_0200760 [Cutaneotrichosporon sp. HIS471]